MARKQTPTLTEAELRIMKVIWEKQEATVNDVFEALSDLQLAYNTILTTMRILEKKGYLRRIKQSRSHVYSPVVTKTMARKNVVRHMMQNFFNDSPELLLLSLVEIEGLDSEDIDRLKNMIDKAKEGK